MSLGSLARAAVRLLTLVVMVASGAYLFIYLYRWEWMRAVIAGLFFLVAQVTLATTMVLSSVRRLDERVGRLERAGHADAADAADAAGVAGTLRHENDERAAARFAFLRRTPEGFGVFVPVLLGAGVVLSALAYGVERVAGALARPTVDRTLVRHLALDLPLGPAGGSDGGADGVRAGPVRAPAPARWHARLAAWAAVVAVAAMLAVAGVDLLRDATQSRPEPLDRAGTTLLDLRIEVKGRAPDPADVAIALWEACRTQLSSGVVVRHQVEPTGPATARLVLDVVLTDLQERRLAGCMQDARLDRVWASVVSWQARPTDAG